MPKDPPSNRGISQFPDSTINIVVVDIYKNSNKCGHGAGGAQDHGGDLKENKTSDHEPHKDARDASP